MRILLAPDKFKGTFSAAEVCRHIRSGVLEALASAEVISHPLADGGEGTLDLLLAALGGERVAVHARGPLGSELTADVGFLPDGSALVESALFCGLELLRTDERNPMATTTYGLGLVLRNLLSRGLSRIVVGLGGSATVDCGLGVARALGFRLLGKGGAELAGSGCDLDKLEGIRPPALRDEEEAGPRIVAFCDVMNPLVGHEGAAEVFASQKGASPAEVSLLSFGLRRAAAIIERDLGVKVTDLPGGGAAGGLGAGLHAFLGADLLKGAGEIARLTGFDRDLKQAALVVTGEGAYDAGNRQGKVVEEVIRRSRELGIPVVVVCGKWEAAPPPAGVLLLCKEGVIDEIVLRGIGRSLALAEGNFGGWDRPPGGPLDFDS